MKIALVDDEQECLDKMTVYCQSFATHCHCHIEIVTFTNGETFINAFESEDFSVVFMDIYMNGVDGMTAAMKMRKQDSRCILIFLTSSMEFMPDAFSCHAFEYITKPFSAQRITDVMTDILKVLPSMSKYIEIFSDRKNIQVFLKDIVSVVTDAHYLDIELSSKVVFRSRMTMQEFMTKTENDSRFIPVNKGITVNAEYILDFKDKCCILKNGTRFPVRVRDYLKIEQAVQDYNFKKIRNRQRH